MSEALAVFSSLVFDLGPRFVRFLDNIGIHLWRMLGLRLVDQIELAK